MVNVRHYNAEGMPAYLTVWERRQEGPWVLVKLLYTRAPGFDKAWAGASEWSEVVLDTEIVLAT